MDCPERDFIERNGTWLLTVVGMLCACTGGVLTYFLKSRCYLIKVCCVECKRDVIALDPENVKIDTTISKD